MIDVEQLRKKAKAAYKGRAFGDAAQLYVEVLASAPEGEPPEVEVSDRTGYAAALVSLHRMDEAVVQFGMALKLIPDDPRLRHKLGDVLSRLTRHQEAAEEYAEAARLEPGDASHHWGMAVEYRALDREEEAQAALQRCLAIDPDHTEARLMQIEQIVISSPERDGQVEDEPLQEPRDGPPDPFGFLKVAPETTALDRVPLRSKPWFWALEVVLLLAGALWLRQQM